MEEKVQSSVFSLGSAKGEIVAIDTEVAANKQALVDYDPTLAAAKQYVDDGIVVINDAKVVADAIEDDYDESCRLVKKLEKDVESANESIVDTGKVVTAYSREVERIAGFVPGGTAPLPPGSLYSTVVHPLTETVDGSFYDVVRCQGVTLTAVLDGDTNRVHVSYDDGGTWTPVTKGDFVIEGTIKYTSLTTDGTLIYCAIHWEDASDFGWLRFMKGTIDTAASTITWTLDKADDVPSKTAGTWYVGKDNDMLVGGMFDGLLTRKHDGTWEDNSAQLRAAVDLAFPPTPPSDEEGDEVVAEAPTVIKTIGGCVISGVNQHVLVGDDSTGKLFKSDDNGLSWTFVDDMPDTKARLAGKGDYIFLHCLVNGMWVSDNNGTSWTACPPIRGMGTVTDAILTGVETYARTKNSRGDLVVTMDGGLTWKIIRVGVNLGFGSAHIQDLFRTDDKNFVTFSDCRLAMADLPTSHEGGIDDSVTTKALKLISADGRKYAEFVFDTRNELVVRMGEKVTTLMDDGGNFESAGNVSGYIQLPTDPDDDE